MLNGFLGYSIGQKTIAGSATDATGNFTILQAYDFAVTRITMSATSSTGVNVTVKAAMYNGGVTLFSSVTGYELLSYERQDGSVLFVIPASERIEVTLTDTSTSTNYVNLTMWGYHIEKGNGLPVNVINKGRPPVIR